MTNSTLLSITEFIDYLREIYAVKHISITTDTSYGNIRFDTEHLVPSEYKDDIYLEDDNDTNIRIIKNTIKSIQLLNDCELHDEIIIDMNDSKMTFIIT